jgi:purine-binding chemotaxis protein CheW
MNSYARMKVAAETYAIPIEQVLEVAELGQVRPVPGARPEVLGLWSLRGQVLPVVDLARLLGVRRAAPPACVLVAEGRGFRVAFAVDEVGGICELGEPAQGAGSDLLAGTTLCDGALIGVLNVPRVFDALCQPGTQDAGAMT